MQLEPFAVGPKHTHHSLVQSRQGNQPNIIRKKDTDLIFQDQRETKKSRLIQARNKLSCKLNRYIHQFLLTSLSNNTKLKKKKSILNNQRRYSSQIS